MLLGLRPVILLLGGRFRYLVGPAILILGHSAEFLLAAAAPGARHSSAPRPRPGALRRGVRSFLVPLPLELGPAIQISWSSSPSW